MVKKVSKRQAALNIIRVEFAKYGKPTAASTRAYVENRISSDVYRKAMIYGLKIYGRM